ncbi:MAG: hypothetical protein JST42_20540 [Bacteroidetes bacterium]|nr:hypothetical protein [Bacteroidota bacterium]
MINYINGFIIVRKSWADAGPIRTFAVSGTKNNGIEWLGHDIMRIGGESMILNGLFFKPDLFARWIDVINEYGLFPMKERIREYIEDYIEIAKDNNIEPYNSTSLGFDAVRIGRIL